MTKGAKPKPRNMKLVDGSFRKDRDNPDQPTPEISAPSVPGYLRGSERRVFRNTAKLLAAMRVISDADVDALAVSAHKMYGPKGIGALYVRQGVDLEPLVHGASHEGGLRAGTENVPYIVGLGQAAQLANDNIEPAHERLAHLRDRLYQRLHHDSGNFI